MICVLATLGQASAESKIGLVALTPDAVNPIAVLTAALSTDPRLALLERTEVDRVFREQQLAAANGNSGMDPIQLGRLLGADGVLSLETVMTGTNRVLRIQLAAVRPGVVLGSLRSAWTPEAAEEWTRIVLSRMDPLWAKLTVERGQAIPVSVVNLVY